jgi:hypothetical protein
LGIFDKKQAMKASVEDLEDQSRYRQLLKLPYTGLVEFILEYIRRRTWIMVLFWTLSILFIGLALTIRINIAGYFPLKSILFHSFLGFLVFPILIIPLHEGLHIIPFILTGARDIRIGADLKQYLFYVTAHRYVISPSEFRFVAYTPFIVVTIALLVLVFFLPGLWKWSLSVLLFVHTTMCAGDFALLNYYHINRNRKLYSVDDADEKTAFFYEEL